MLVSVLLAEARRFATAHPARGLIIVLDRAGARGGWGSELGVRCQAPSWTSSPVADA